MIASLSSVISCYLILSVLVYLTIAIIVPVYFELAETPKNKKHQIVTISLGWALILISLLLRIYFKNTVPARKGVDADQPRTTSRQIPQQMGVDDRGIGIDWIKNNRKDLTNTSVISKQVPKPPTPPPTRKLGPW